MTRTPTESACPSRHDQPAPLVSPRAVCAYVALGVLLTQAAAAAELKLDTSLAAVGQYDSNVLRVEPGPVLTAVSPSGETSDRVLNAVATANLQYKLDRQRLYVMGDATRQWYKRFNQLNHDEYSATGGLDWTGADWIDGTFSVHQDHRMVPEAARLVPSLSLDFQTDQNASAGLNVNVAPQWRMESKFDWIKQDSPSITAPFYLNERDYTVAGKYLGLGQVAMGLQLQYQDGVFTGPIVPPNTVVTLAMLPLPQGTSQFHQYNEDLTVDYTVNQMSKLTSKLGASQRRVPGSPNAAANGFTGELQYKRTVSALTKVTLGVFRRLQTFPSFSDYVTESGASAQLDWQPTLKLYTSVLAQYIDDSYHGSDRSDKLALLDAGVNYQWFEHFSLKPGFHFEDRKSSTTYSYIDRIYSLEAKLMF